MVNYFHWDLSIFGDFFILGFFILGCVCDYIFCPSFNMFVGHFKSINYTFINNKFSLFRNNISRDNNTGVSSNVNSSLNRNDSLNNNNNNRMESFKDKVKRRLFWVM